jgi:ribosomal protein S18 acetylase RimI-like enzyme
MLFQIRPFHDDDLPRLKVLTVEAFEPVSIDRNIEQQVGGPLNGRDWRWRKAKHVEEDVQRDRDGCFVAHVGDAIIGYITTWNDPEAGVGYIPNLAVDAEYRGQGIGRQLIEHALAYFRSLGLPYARIETLEQNPIGQKLYPDLGFQEVARQIHFGMRLD